MNTDFTLEFRRNYIHIQYAPGYEVNLEGLRELWSEIGNSCKTHSCRNIFIEGTIDSWKMNLSDVYNSGIEASHTISGAKIALCFVDCTEIDLTEFFQLVAANRGARVKSFFERHQALQWLGVEEHTVISEPISIDTKQHIN